LNSLNNSIIFFRLRVERREVCLCVHRSGSWKVECCKGVPQIRFSLALIEHILELVEVSVFFI